MFLINVLYFWGQNPIAPGNHSYFLFLNWYHSKVGNIGITSNTESICSIFMNGHDVRPFVVQEGMWIGDFAAGATAGFEIILAESSYIPTLEYARATEHKVEITTQTGFAAKKKREEILNFIDPAAFYGLFYKTYNFDSLMTRN